MRNLITGYRKIFFMSEYAESVEIMLLLLVFFLLGEQGSRELDPQSCLSFVVRHPSFIIRFN
jgi:hypothetical protein